ncbi:MAG: GT4 family glycosyltransferase PelF [Candidatus Riflebacteria bacterium]|nr:GT4 family glycosyltransferase PelF [Candidatus Riflebacteria bacterium]
MNTDSSKQPELSLLPEVDVELVLEGSYPYVTGGVSAWVHRLIIGLPEIRFGLIHFAAKNEDTKKLRYDLPENVKYLQNLYLQEAVFVPPVSNSETCLCKDLFPEFLRMHKMTKNSSVDSFAEIFTKLTDSKHLHTLRELFFCRESFGLLKTLYNEKSSNASFLDYFWTWRFMHLPLVQILQMRRGKTSLVHSVSTGYAGFYAALRKLTENCPFILTEHGIYTRERNIEISQSSWIHEEKHPDHLVRSEPALFKGIWINFFNALGNWSYQEADRIITLFEGNRTAQISLGADPQKIEIIPNGIEMEKFFGLRSERPPSADNFKVGFIGRIVSIKDIRTFLRAVQIVLLQIPLSDYYIIGPLDEEPYYSTEMQKLTETLGITDRVHFLGRQNVIEWYSQLDVCVLTSLSEGQPLTVLEGMAAGIPQIVTDVGSCRELVEGHFPEDKGIGPCGIVTEPCSPAQTANAILSICRTPELFSSMSRAGKNRVKTYYQEKNLFNRYLRIYQNYITK